MMMMNVIVVVVVVVVVVVDAADVVVVVVATLSSTIWRSKKKHFVLIGIFQKLVRNVEKNRVVANLTQRTREPKKPV